MKLFGNFFKNRTIMFYAASGAAVLSLITGIVYMSALNGLSKDFSFAPGIIMIIAAAAFGVCALFRLSRTGAAVLAAADFAAIMIYVVTIFGYILEQAMTAFEFGKIEGIGAVIACAVLMIACAAAANVFAWFGLDREIPTGRKEGIVNEKDA